MPCSSRTCSIASQLAPPADQAGQRRHAPEAEPAGGGDSVVIEVAGLLDHVSAVLLRGPDAGDKVKLVQIFRQTADGDNARIMLKLNVSSGGRVMGQLELPAPLDEFKQKVDALCAAGQPNGRWR